MKTYDSLLSNALQSARALTNVDFILISFVFWNEKLWSSTCDAA